VVVSPCGLSGEVVCFVGVCDLLLSGAVNVGSSCMGDALRLGSSRNFAAELLQSSSQPCEH
jgi:hypothetical protein